MKRPPVSTLLVFLALSAVMLVGTGSEAYYDFEERFDEAERPWMLEQVEGGTAAEFHGGAARFPGQEPGFLATEEKDFWTTDFVAAVTVYLPAADSEAFLGVGRRASDSAFHCYLGENYGEVGGRRMGLKEQYMDRSGHGPPRQGMFRMRLTWDVDTRKVLCEFAEGGTGEFEVIPPQESEPWEGEGPESSSLFVGGVLGAAFDRLEVTGTHAGVE